jgi:hypothetical protein
MNLSAIKGTTYHWNNGQGGLCTYCGDSRHFMGICTRKFNTVSGQVEMIPFQEDLGKSKEKKEELGKV